MSAQKQSHMFEKGEDLPLFSGSPQEVRESTFAPGQGPRQLTLGNCPICQDTGTVKDNGRVKRCTCEVGQRVQPVQPAGRWSYLCTSCFQPYPVDDPLDPDVICPYCGEK